MTLYRVSASIRDKAHKEVRNVRTLWQGPADDSRQAIVSAQQALGPLVKDEPRADTIVLHAHDPKGGVVTTTEYAEDFLIGAGASLGSALLDEHSDHGLSEEDTAAAKKALQAKAVAAVMPQQRILDNLKEFFSGQQIDPASVDERPAYGPDGTRPMTDAEAEHLGVDKEAYRWQKWIDPASVLAPDDVDATRAGIEDMARRMIDPASVDEGHYATGGFIPNEPLGSSQYNSNAISDPFGTIYRGLHSHKARQEEVGRIIVSKEIFGAILDHALVPGTAQSWRNGRISGIPVEINRSFHPDRIHYLTKPVNHGGFKPRRTTYTFDAFVRKMYKELKNPNPFTHIPE